MNVNDGEEAENNPDDLIALKLAAELEKGEATLADLQQLVDSDNNITPGVIAQYKELIKKRMTQQSSAHQSSSSASDTPVSQLPREPEDDKTRVVKYERETASTSVTLNSFANFTYHIQKSQCRTCKEPFFSSEIDIRTLFQDWTDGRANKLTSDLKCKSCGTYSCIACIPKPFSRSSRIGFQHKKQHVSWCCVGGRLFIVWVLLCGFDRHLQESRNIGSKVNKTISDANLKKSNINKKGKKPKSSGSHLLGQNFMPRGMGYGSASYDFNFDKLEDIDMADNMELMKTHQFLQEPVNSPYHSNPSSSSNEKANDKEMAMDAQVKEDKFGVLILGLLTDLLPSLLRETSFDLDPPPAVIEMLQRSRVLNYCAELLRNDSLIDIVKRVDMYQTIFNFMTTMGSHSGTSEGLFRPRPNRPEAVDLLTSSFYAALPEQEEQAPALSECLDNLIKQSSLVLESAKSKEDDFASEDGQTLLRICHQVLELAQFIEANSREQGKVTAAAIPEVVVIKDVEDKDIFPRHKYALDARRLNFSPPGRFKRLITEITTLNTSLPPGIFVRYGENRPDVLKCIIIGPLGTPYENGIFEFDIFCGSTFPNDPPSVAFRGTGGGTVSINPNLYADGKVCLSLLGTWSGEPWEPGESTLLQVLISIQAMIFCEEPWYNEPGREIAYHKSITGTPSEKYNQKIQQYTVRYAILDWLEKAPELWKDVVMHHFTQHGNIILEKVEEWFSKNTSTAVRTPDQFQVQHYDTFKGTYVSALERPKTRPDMSSTVERLQTAMQKYGATYKIAYVPPPPEKQPSPQNIMRPQFGPSPTGFFEGYGAPSPTPTPTHPHFMSPQLSFPPGLFNPQPPAPPIPPFMHTHFQHGGHSPALPGHGGYMGGGQVPGTGTSSYNTWEHQMQSHGGSVPGNFPGPPSSNTRLAAARGRGGDAGGSSGRGGPFHPGPGAFGHGRGRPTNYVPGPFFGDPSHGGRGGGRGWGRGRGQGRGRGNTGGRGGG